MSKKTAFQAESKQMTQMKRSKHNKTWFMKTGFQLTKTTDLS